MSLISLRKSAARARRLQIQFGVGPPSSRVWFLTGPHEFRFLFIANPRPIQTANLPWLPHPNPHGRHNTLTVATSCTYAFQLKIENQVSV